MAAIALGGKSFKVFGARWSSTIYALSSAHGKSGVALIRVSGPASRLALESLTGKKRHPDRKATVRKLYDPRSGVLLDESLTVWFPGPNSFTGEDVAEFQVHGGRAVVRSVLAALGGVEGLRPALAGEYVRRAHAAGKLDLTQVEGLSDLINAETEHQRLLAVRQMGGVLQERYENWSRRLLDSLARVEAYVDFADSGDVEDDAIVAVEDRCVAIREEIEKDLKDFRSGELLRNGVRTALVGNPNVGKSSILNLLVQRPAAIVSPIAGTTRDVIETCLEIAGFPLILIDTAGRRAEEEIADPIEKIGVERAKETAEGADLLVGVVEAGRLLKEGVEETVGDLLEGSNAVSRKILAINKSDLLSEKERFEVEFKIVPALNYKSCLISCRTEDGLENLLRVIGETLGSICANSGSSVVPTRERHRHHLKATVGHLEKFLASKEEEWVVRAHHLTLAYKELGLITGRGSMVEVHDAIFSDFCIGK